RKIERERQFEIEAIVDGDDALGIGRDIVGADPCGHRARLALGEGPRKGRQRHGSAEAEAELAAGGMETGHGVLTALRFLRGSITKLISIINLSWRATPLPGRWSRTSNGSRHPRR